MGYHADIYNALASLIDAAMPNPTTVTSALDMTEAKLEKFSRGVIIVRESITLDPHPEVNPSTSVEAQPEQWTWALYVIGGGGGSRPHDRATHVDALLETLRTALNAQRLTADCGPLHLVSEDYEGQHNNGVMYAQRWTHSRLG